LQLPPLEYVLPLFAILLVSLSFHEAAHAWTADRLGDPTARHLGRITMNPLAHIDWIGTVLFPLVALMSNFPLLGWAKPVPVNFAQLKSPRRDFAIIAAAGPASNLVIAVSVAVVVMLIGGKYEAFGSYAGIWLLEAVSLNVLLAVFNMIPVPPLDGGNVLMGFLPESMAQLVDLLRPWGFLILYLLLFSGLLSEIVIPFKNAIERVLLP
jgi:Zn-dependent protease